MQRGWVVAFVVLLAAGARGTYAQQAEPEPTPPRSTQAAPSGPTFKAGVDVVALTVAVTDRDNRFIGGLGADDFIVFEDGIQQPLSFFGVADVPLDLALLMDTSASMTGRMELVRRAAGGLVRSLRPGDRCALVEFRDAVRVLQSMTAGLDRLDGALASLRPAGGTALYNALYVSLKDFERLSRDDAAVRRQAIVVLSDGEDTMSLLDFDEVLALARRSGVTVYTVGLRSPVDTLRDRGRSFSESEFAMRTLARETGGQSFFPPDANELSPVYAAIGDELAHQYALGYTSTNPLRDGAYRRVVVRVASRPDARPRTRAGYLAPTSITRVGAARAVENAPN